MFIAIYFHIYLTNIFVLICTQTCKEAHEGSVLCTQRIAKLFKEINI